MPRRIDVADLAKRICAGERASLSRGITLVESTRQQDRPLAEELLNRTASCRTVESSDEQTFRLGITGSPGAGKSTFIEQYGMQLIKEGHRLAVLAVDPSSTRTHGSILGDKTRMHQLSTEPNAYIRPSPAGRTLGGVARSTREAILLCEAAGYDRIIVETVGVGQSEHTVQLLTDCMVLLVLPASGDDLQGIKRGIVELADLVLVHKADGDRQRTARDTAADYRRALHLQPKRSDNWSPAAVTGSSVTKDGLAKFNKKLSAYRETLGTAGILERRSHQNLQWFERSWEGAVLDMLRANETFARLVQQQRQAVLERSSSVEQARHALLETLSKHLTL